MKNTNANGWIDYELLDSGDGKKLERFGLYTVIRPDPRVIWKRRLSDKVWGDIQAEYTGEKWEFKSPIPLPWRIDYKKIRFELKPTEFKHVGVFPEQAENWDWITEQITNNKSQNSNLNILNLFAYTGGATMAAALAGAKVTHVDASRPAMMWASENAKLAGIDKDRVRWIQEDAMKFVKREARRGMKYDGIIMDPPRFGRGASGEVWKLEDDLPKIVWACKEIVSESPLFFLINAYTADLSHVAIKNLLTEVMGEHTESGELGLKETGSERVLPAGIYARWSLA